MDEDLQKSLLDVHFCFGCQSTIFGLDAYVEHRRSQCPGVSKDGNNLLSLPTSSNTAQSPVKANGVSLEGFPDLSKAGQFQTLLSVAQHALPLPQPPATNTNYAPGSGKTTTHTTLENKTVPVEPEKTDNFFLSLELQSKSGQKGDLPESDGTEVRSETKEKDLPISSILSNLEFSSEDEATEFCEGENYWVPPHSHTGGKWRPGQRPQRRESHPHPEHTGGKWKPGESPTGKRKRGRPKKLDNHVLDIIDDDDSLAELSSRGFACDECPEMFDTIEAYAQHIAAGHDWDDLANRDTTCRVTIQDPSVSKEECLGTEKGDTLPEPQPNQTPDPLVHKCTVCDKEYHNKYSIARHILTQLHKRRADGHPDRFKMIKDYLTPLMYLSPYQCMICRYYFNTAERLQEHVQTEKHKLCISKLICPIVCSICNFSTIDHDGEMYEHLTTPEHLSISEKSNKPCVIKKKINGALKCPYCGTAWKSYYMLQRHVEQRHPEGQPTQPIFKGHGRRKPKCPFCLTPCHSLTALTIHVRRKHTRDRPFQCNCCHVSFCDKHSLQLHFKSIKHKKHMLNPSASPPNSSSLPKAPRNNLSHKCPQCDFVASNYRALRPHFLEAHSNDKVFCLPCKREFVSQKGLEIHQRATGHSNKTINDGVNLTLKCPKCSKTFQDPKWFEFHMLSHTHIFCEADLFEKFQGQDKTSLRYEKFLREVELASRTEVVVCPEPDCLKGVIKPHMVEHLRIHANDRIFQCPYCEQGFFSSTVLKKHIHKHLGLTHRVCGICGKEFMKVSTYKNHLLTHDETMKNQHVCSMCGMAFTFLECLRVHERRHGEKIHICTYLGCRQKFIFKSELTEHSRIHSGEKPFLCDTCGYKSRTKNHMLRHSRTHTGERNYHCEYCTYKAGNKTHLRRHMRIHIGTKPYKCPYCSYCCNTHENIRKHIIKTKKHEGLKIYPCKYCEFGSNVAKDFRHHLEDHHVTQLQLENKDVSSVIAGIYDKSGDFSKPLEGNMIVPIRERKRGGKRVKSGKRLMVKIGLGDNKSYCRQDYLPDDAEAALRESLASSSVIQYSGGEQRWLSPGQLTIVTAEDPNDSLQDIKSFSHCVEETPGPTDYSLHRHPTPYDNQPTGHSSIPSFRELSSHSSVSLGSTMPLYCSSMYKYGSYSTAYQTNNTDGYHISTVQPLFQAVSSEGGFTVDRHSPYALNQGRLDIQHISPAHEEGQQNLEPTPHSEVPMVASSVDIY